MVAMSMHQYLLEYGTTSSTKTIPECAGRWYLHHRTKSPFSKRSISYHVLALSAEVVTIALTPTSWSSRKEVLTGELWVSDPRGTKGVSPVDLLDQHPPLIQAARPCPHLCPSQPTCLPSPTLLTTQTGKPLRGGQPRPPQSGTVPQPRP